MSIYRAYDIRGVYGKDLTDDVAEDLGRAFASTFKGKCAVGYDVRVSSPPLSKSLIKGLLSSGIDVVDLGLVPTPLLYFAVHHLKLAGGVMITGSHNPPDYNGFKVWRGSTTISGEEIQELRKIVEAGKFKTGAGKLEKKDVVPAYVEYVKQRIKLKKKLKVVVDSSNGNAGSIVPRLLRDLGCEVIELYSKPDGTFPNHPADPTVDDNMKDLIAVVTKEKADLGVAFDGDADRAGFISDKGEIIRGDQALIIFSREILEKKKGAKIICEVKCSQALLEDVKVHGGIPLMYKTGHSFIKNKLKQEHALLAGEMSGHFYFADDYPGYDDGIYASLRMTQILSKTDKKISEMLTTQPKYVSTPELRVECPDDQKFKIVDEVSQALQKKGLDVLTIDGARIQYPDGWGLIRASNTTPKLILRFEAKTPERLEEIKKIILDELQKHIKINLSA
ncbi:MAG: phosphomannomutase/phosphoglucomutase [Candidatus Altiarchaeota archaeon]|nr:phosphomannomutase/phosphoglucomutase [Candidatus Altiarchaeota archaeon]